MAIIVIDIGNVPNDGTGDPIRTAFDHVNENFALLDGQLNNWGNLRADTLTVYNVESLGNISANIGTIFSDQFESNSAVITEFYSTNISATNTGTISNLVSDSVNTDALDVTTDATLGGTLTVSGVTTLNSNVTLTGSIIPTANLTYDLGSPAAFFRNLYTQGLVQVNTVSLEADASLLLLQANLIPGNQKDVGVLGKYYNGSGNTYAYFGFQKATEDFVYIKTDTDASAGNSIIASGTYGNARFGSQFLSNTTPATNTTTGALIVAGGAGIAGNTYSTTFVGNVSSTLANITNLTVSNRVDGNLTVQGTIFSNSKRVITEDYVTGNVYLGGNIGVARTNFIWTGLGSDSTSTATGAVVVTAGIGVGGNIYAGGNVVASTGLVGPYYGTVQTASQPNITGLGTLGNLSVANNITAGGTVSGAQISGTVADFTANVSAGNFNAPAGIVRAATGNFTTINGNLSASNLTSGTIPSSTLGNSTVYIGTTSVALNRATGNLALTGITSIDGNSATATKLATARSINGVAFDGSADITITAAATTVSAANITGTTLSSNVVNSSLTSVGTLGSLAVTGNVTAGNLITGGGTTTVNNGIITTGNVTAGNVIATHYGNTIGTTGTFTGNVTTGNISGTNHTGTTVTVTGNISGANINGAHYGSGAGLTSIPNGALTNSSVTVNGTTISLGGNGTVTANASTLSGTYLNSTVIASSLTSVGTLTGLTVSGNIVPNANATINLGSSSAWFGTVYGVSTQAKYADLAENYLADAEYAPGTVVMFGGSEEITLATLATTAVAGIVSTNPAYLMNADLNGRYVTPVAFTGRVPCRVTGPVNKGDVMVAGNNGTAVSIKTIPSTYSLELGSVIGKALGTNEGGDAVIEVVVGRF